MKSEDFLKSDREILHRLVDANLNIPDLYNQLSQLPKPLPGARKTQYASTVELFEDKFLERTWAFKWHYNKIQYKEVIRRFEGNNEILTKDIYFTTMGGYNTMWDDKFHSYYQPNFDDWYFHDSKYFYVPTKRLYTFVDCINLDPTIKYCGFNDNVISFIDYISTFRVYPKIEMISKFGLLHLMSDSRFLNKLDKEISFKRYVSKNCKDISIHKANYVEILRAYNSNTSIGRYFSLINIYNNSIYKNNIKFFNNKINNIIEYVKTQNTDVSTYLDYYDIARNYVDMSDSKNLYPKNLLELHDFYFDKVQEEKNKELYDSFRKVANEYKNYKYSNGQLMIRVANNVQELINEGKALGHCVGKGTYDKKMANRETLIFFVRCAHDPVQSYYTLECKPDDLKTVQCRTKGNKSATEDINQFLNEWQNYINSNVHPLEVVV